jgi:hypothetical protein
MNYTPFLIIGGILVVAAVIGYFGHRAEVKRTEALRQTADDMGFEFQPHPGIGVLARYPGFNLFSQGRSQNVWNLLRGRAGGLEVAVFDYSYVTGSGKNRRSWKQTVLAFEIDGARLPAFSLRPESVFHKIGQWFGYHDIDFSSHPRFSSNYLLRAEDEDAVRELFHDGVLEYFEQATGVCTEAGGDRLIYYRSMQRIRPDEVRAFLEQGFEVLALFRPPDKGAAA